MFPKLDPSQMSPELISELSTLMQSLPMDQILKMQALMQKSMAGTDTTAELIEFERSLPQSFRDRLMQITSKHSGEFSKMASSSGQNSVTQVQPSQAAQPINDIKQARMTILEAIADGQVKPADAYALLF